MTNPPLKRTDPVVERFWLVLQEPELVPKLRGPFQISGMAATLREFITANPTAYIHVLTVGEDGDPQVEHGPEALQVLDGRSMGVGRKHNERTRAAHAGSHAALQPSTVTEGWQPIETAPKDGTQILICGGTCHEDWPENARPFKGVCIAEWDDFYSDEKEACPWQGPQWAHDEYRWHRPTHWQPLPEPAALAALAPTETGRPAETVERGSVRSMRAGESSKGISHA